MSDMLMLEKRCGGCGRGIPIRFFPEAADFYRSCSPTLPPDHRVETFRCRCRTFTLITVGDILSALPLVA